MHLFSMQTVSEVQLYHPQIYLLPAARREFYLLNSIAHVLQLKYEEMLTYLTLPINIVNLVLIFIVYRISNRIYNSIKYIIVWLWLQTKQCQVQNKYFNNIFICLKNIFKSNVIFYFIIPHKLNDVLVSD